MGGLTADSFACAWSQSSLKIFTPILHKYIYIFFGLVFEYYNYAHAKTYYKLSGWKHVNMLGIYVYIELVELTVPAQSTRSSRFERSCDT